ncbi:MAG: hypothetical protein HOQ44_11860 [Nocardia sp.]|nr:hypothetical protein [Nocardia sp.]
MRSLRSRGVRRYGATRPPRGVRAEVLVKSSLGSWELQPATQQHGSDRRVSSSRPSGGRGSTAPGGRDERRANNSEGEAERSSR